MPTLNEIFYLHRAKSDLYSEYAPGTTAYIGNTIADNGVMGYITPLPGDRVFNTHAIVVSAFCDATIQSPPFVACGRAGNGLVVLEPRTEMNLNRLAKYAAYINIAVKWRFNWYRQVTADRLKEIEVPKDLVAAIDFSVNAHLPNASDTKRSKWKLNTSKFTLETLFDLIPGNFHSLGELSPGKTPVISCGNDDNGLAGYFDVKHHLFKDRLTIALNGSPLTTKYHPYAFAAKDDVAICIPKIPLSLSTLLFIQATLERERWRYSYYRKCYMNKLKRFAIQLPTLNGELDEAIMHRVVKAAPYWDFLINSISYPRK